MSFRHLAVIKENHDAFISCLTYGHIDGLAEVFRLNGKSVKQKTRTDLITIDKSRISQLNTAESEDFFLEFASLPKVSKDKVVIYTDGACDIEEDPKTNINWAGPRAGVGVYFDVQNFKNHISAYVEQQPRSNREEAKTVIERAEAQALLAALVLIRTYNYRWIVLTIDWFVNSTPLQIHNLTSNQYFSKNVLHSIVRYIRNGPVPADLTETFDMLFHVLFTALPAGVNVILKKVKSHSGIAGNENADHLAKNGKRKQYTMLEMIEFMESFVPKTSGTGKKKKKKKNGFSQNGSDEWTVASTGRNKRHSSSSTYSITESSLPKHLSLNRRYRFWIVYVPHCIENWQIEAVVSADSKVSQRPKNSDFHKRDVLVETSHLTYVSLIARGHVTFHGGGCGGVSICCTVVPYVLQCDRCLQIGHFGTYCPRPDIVLCGICGRSGHQHAVCPTPKRNVCYNCRQARVPADHSTFSNECPQRLPHIEKERAWARKMIQGMDTTRTAGDASKEANAYSFIDLLLTI